MDQRLCSLSDKFKKLKRSAGSFQKGEGKKKKKGQQEMKDLNQPAVQLNQPTFISILYTPTLSLPESIRIVNLLAVFIKSLNGSSPMCFTAPVTSR